MGLTSARVSMRTSWLRIWKRRAVRKLPTMPLTAKRRRDGALGKTKAEFFRDEQAALEPFQPGLFDDLIDG